MNVVIPPLIFYILGMALVVAGSVRVWTLGRRHPERELADDDPKKAGARRRHLAFGIVWFLLGGFLIVSTAGVLRSRSESSRAATTVVSPSQHPPVFKLSPERPTSVKPPATP